MVQENRVWLAGADLDRRRHISAFFHKFGAGVMLDIVRTRPMALIGGVLNENASSYRPRSSWENYASIRGEATAIDRSMPLTEE